MSKTEIWQGTLAHYTLTRSGRKQLAKEANEWNQTTAIVARFLAPVEDQS